MLQTQREFFDRQMKLHQVGENGQRKLLSSKILVVGAGGLASSALQYLCSMGVGNITICDYDNVESSNLHRQVLFNQNDIGKNKAIVAKEKLELIGPWTKIDAIAEFFNDTNCSKLISDHDLVLDCTDNLNTKFLIHDECFKYKTDLIQSSIHKFDGQLQVFTFSKKIDGCLRCLWDTTPIQIGNCNDNGVLAVVAGLFGLMQANEAVKTLLNLSELKSNELITFDVLSLSTNKIKFKQNKDCKLCGKHAIEKGDSMSDIELIYTKINPDDYTWLDIRIASAAQPLNTKVSAINVITKTDTEIIHEFDTFDNQRPFIIICDRGIRSLNLAQHLRELGYENIFSLKNGFMNL